VVDYKVVDSREDRQMIEMAVDLGYKVGTLPYGDYAYGSCIVERKSDDFLDIKRLFAQLHELRSSRYTYYLVVDKSLKYFINKLTMRYMGEKENASNVVIGLVASCSMRGAPPIFAGSKRNAMRIIDAILEKANDGKNRDVDYTPVRHISGDDIATSILAQFPGVSLKRAKSLLNTPFVSKERTLSEVMNLAYIYPVLDEDTLVANDIKGMEAKLLNILRMIEERR